MPRIELQDPFGYYYSIQSSNPDTIAAWLIEHIRRFNTPNVQLMDIRMRVQPGWVSDPDTGQLIADWPVNDQSWIVPPGKMLDEIIKRLVSERDKGNG